PPAETVEPFGYYCECKGADPAFLRAPAYIPPTDEIHTTTPLYTRPPARRETWEEAAETVSREEYDDKVDGLTADLERPVEVAYRRGATEWVRLNYRNQYAALRARATEERDDG